MKIYRFVVIAIAFAGSLIGSSGQAQVFAEEAVDAPKANCDIPNQNLRAVKTKNEHDCSGECLLENECKAYVFVSGWGRCFLKLHAGKVFSLTMHAGQIEETMKRNAKGKEEKVRVALPIQENRDSTGKDFQRIDFIDSAKLCQDRCLVNDLCKSYVWIDAYNTCWLKSDQGELRPKVFYCGKKKK